jgi:hypothetical protein
MIGGFTPPIDKPLHCWDTRKQNADIFRRGGVQDHFIRLYQGQPFAIEAHITSILGKENIVRYLANPLLNENGQVSGCVLIAEDITERKRTEAEREQLVYELQEALAKVKTLSGLRAIQRWRPICASCKKIRDDQGYWHQIEV